jgi:biotin synthase
MNKHTFSSPEFVRISRASTISLNIASGWMYKSAVNRCVNLLLQYPEGCYANCAYCGLARHRPYKYEDRSFIHVDWPIYSIDLIIEKINSAPQYVKRTCISMITNKKAFEDTCTILAKLKAHTNLPVSILISPTVLKGDALERFKALGADKIGIAIDLAKEELFEQYRGKGVKGPHSWDRYWETLIKGLEVFGYKNVGVHLMVGMGETEEEMVRVMDRIHRMGGTSHLFSFFAEKGSLLEKRPQPPWSQYLRVQLARYLIETGLSSHALMRFGKDGQILHFGLSQEVLDPIVESGIPFMTTGCTDGGEVSCNRPFGNCLPGERQWNYPYRPDPEEIGLIKNALFC